MTDQPDIWAAVPDQASTGRRFLRLSELSDQGDVVTIVTEPYEHPRAKYGLKGPSGLSLAVDAVLSPGDVPVTLVLSESVAVNLKRLRPLKGKRLRMWPNGEAALDGA